MSLRQNVPSILRYDCNHFVGNLFISMGITWGLFTVAQVVGFHLSKIRNILAFELAKEKKRKKKNHNSNEREYRIDLLISSSEVRPRHFMRPKMRTVQHERIWNKQTHWNDKHDDKSNRITYAIHMSFNYKMYYLPFVDNLSTKIVCIASCVRFWHWLSPLCVYMRHKVFLLCQLFQ